MSEYREVWGLYGDFKGLHGFLVGEFVGNSSLEWRWEFVVLGECLRFWLGRSYRSGEVLWFMGEVEWGFEFWFTFLLVDGFGSTDNVVECVLRELVVVRKIMGTLRNEKGTAIYETMMTLITTWGKQGLDTFEQMKTSLIQAWTQN